MITLSWWTLMGSWGALLIGGYCVGLATGLWCRERPPAVMEAWHSRTAREWDEGRWRDGSTTDGAWRGVRWLPTEESRTGDD
jgi:hypothetical protein